MSGYDLSMNSTEFTEAAAHQKERSHRKVQLLPAMHTCTQFFNIFLDLIQMCAYDFL